MYRIGPPYIAIRQQLLDRATPRGFDVVEGEIGQGDDANRLPASNDGAIRPVAVLMVGAPEAHPRGKGITSVRDDLGLWDVSVMCLAGDYFSVIQLVDQVREALLGFTPPNCGEMSEIASLPRVPVGSFVAPYRYRMMVGFVLSIDANVVS